MKKTGPLLLIIMGIFAFIATIVIAVLSPKLPDFIATYGFIIMGYISILIFTVGMFKLNKDK